MENHSEGDVTWEEWSERCGIVGFEDRGRGQQAEGSRWPPEAGSGRETHLPQES